MPERIQIYVDNVDGNDHPETAGDQRHPVRTADKAFSLLPDHWTGQAEIIFVPRPEPYDINTDSIYLGTPVGFRSLPAGAPRGRLSLQPCSRSYRDWR